MFYFQIMSLLNLLFKRSQFDLGVSSFLRKVFLLYPEYLQTYRLVCRDWNHFIKQIFGSESAKKFLEYKISRRLRSDPLQILAVKLSVELQERINDNLGFECDDDLAVVDVSDLDAGAILVVDLNLLEQKLISLGGFDFNNGETVKYAIGPGYFCTAFSHDNKITFWDKKKFLRHETGIFSVECKYIRCIKIWQDLVFIVGRTNVYMICQKDLLIESVENFTIPDMFGSTRSVLYDGKSCMLTAHDRFVQIWDKNSGVPERRIETGLVVEMVSQDDILVTVGSCQTLGLRFWNIRTASLLRIFYPDQSFYNIKLAQDQILLRGNSVSTVFVNFGSVEISDKERRNPEDDDPYYLTDISPSKAFFLDISRQTLLIKHYWQVLTDISSITKSDLLPLPLPYQNHSTVQSVA